MLFRYLDKSGKGEIGYHEFTMLLEERWRNLDPYSDQELLGLPFSTLDIYKDCRN